MRSLFLVLIFATNIAEAKTLIEFIQEKTQNGPACFQASPRTVKRLQVLKNNYGDFSPDKNKKVLRVTLKAEQSGEVSAMLELKAQVEVTKNKGLGNYEKTVVQTYKADLVCIGEEPSEEGHCFVECDGGRIYLAVNNLGALELSSPGVRMLNCGGLESEIWIKSLADRTVSLQATSNRYCR